MADTPSFRTGHLSVLLPASTPEHRIRSLVRQMVVDAPAAAMILRYVSHASRASAVVR